MSGKNTPGRNGWHEPGIYRPSGRLSTVIRLSLYRHSRVSGNPEMRGLMMLYYRQATAGFPLTRE